jgi:cobalt-zinc-cadmium efflux system outer membrane protein
MSRGLPLLTILAGALTWAPAPARAETVDVAALLGDPAALLRWVAGHHADAAAARARVSQADAELDASGLFQNPSLDTSVGNIPVGRSNPGSLSLSNSVVLEVGLGQTIELGKRGPRMAAAGARAQAARLDLADTLLDRAADAREALARVAWARERATILDESLTASRRGVTLEQSRRDNGDLSGNDFRRLELDASSLEADVARAHAELDAALSTCGATLRADCQLGPGWDGILDAAPLLPAAPPAAAAALAERPDLRSLELQREGAEQDAILAGRRAIPDLGLHLGFTQSQFTISGDNPHVLAFGLSIPLPTFDRGQADEARALAHARELAATADGIRSTARAEIDGLTRRLQFLDETIARLQKTAVPESQLVLDGTERALHQGQVSLTDLLLARRTHIALLLSVLDLRLERFEARSGLRHDLALDAAFTRGVGP